MKNEGGDRSPEFIIPAKPERVKLGTIPPRENFPPIDVVPRVGVLNASSPKLVWINPNPPLRNEPQRSVGSSKRLIAHAIIASGAVALTCTLAFAVATFGFLPVAITIGSAALIGSASFIPRIIAENTRPRRARKSN